MTLRQETCGVAEDLERDHEVAGESAMSIMLLRTVDTCVVEVLVRAGWIVAFSAG